MGAGCLLHGVETEPAEGSTAWASLADAFLPRGSQGWGPQGCPGTLLPAPARKELRAAGRFCLRCGWGGDDGTPPIPHQNLSAPRRARCQATAGSARGEGGASRPRPPARRRRRRGLPAPRGPTYTDLRAVAVQVPLGQELHLQGKEHAAVGRRPPPRCPPPLLSTPLRSAPRPRSPPRSRRGARLPPAGGAGESRHRPPGTPLNTAEGHCLTDPPPHRLAWASFRGGGGRRGELHPETGAEVAAEEVPWMAV